MPDTPRVEREPTLLRKNKGHISSEEAQEEQHSVAPARKEHASELSTLQLLMKPILTQELLLVLSNQGFSV